jgi:hypothetical protein
MGSNPSRGVSVFVFSCVHSALVVGLIAVRGVLPSLCKIRGVRINPEGEEARGSSLLRLSNRKLLHLWCSNQLANAFAEDHKEPTNISTHSGKHSEDFSANVCALASTVF